MNEFPNKPGTYALQFSLSQGQRTKIGYLGEFYFPPGDYIYLGSARGPGGLRARINRHLADHRDHQHWHIDYLHAFANWRAYCLLEFSQTISQPTLECLWSQALAALPGASIPATRFGASDCRLGCLAHLIAFENTPHKQPVILTSIALRTVLSQAASITIDALQVGLCQVNDTALHYFE